MPALVVVGRAASPGVVEHVLHRRAPGAGAVDFSGVPGGHDLVRRLEDEVHVRQVHAGVRDDGERDVVRRRRPRRGDGRFRRAVWG